MEFRIISGGQTGVDRLALETALQLGLKTGGYAPAGYLTTKGPDPSLGSVFGLQELKSPDYAFRSRKNVDLANATLAFRFHPSIGTDKTIAYCRTGKWLPGIAPTPISGYIPGLHRPCLVIDKLDEELTSDTIVNFITSNHVKITTLNIVGHREVSESQATLITKILTKVFENLKANFLAY